MKNFFLNLKSFLKDTAEDERIPMRDKKVVAGLIVLIILPLDFIFGWIQLYNMLADLFMLSLILNYLFTVIDQSILLSHYPWGMKSFARIRRVADVFSFFVPNFISDNIWKYVKEPF